jgi:hypothetical protein
MHLSSPHSRYITLRNIYLHILLPTAHLLSPFTTTLSSAFLSLCKVPVQKETIGKPLVEKERYKKHIKIMKYEGVDWLS